MNTKILTIAGATLAAGIGVAVYLAVKNPEQVEYVKLRGKHALEKAKDFIQKNCDVDVKETNETEF